MSDTPRTDAQWSGFHEFTKDFDGILYDKTCA